jgi:hypothetical protein
VTVQIDHADLPPNQIASQISNQINVRECPSGYPNPKDMTQNNKKVSI